MRIQNLENLRDSHQKAADSLQDFWSQVAQSYQWQRPWDTVLSGGFEQVDFKWFEGGKLNITENCLDRHLETRGEKNALIFEPNDPTDAPQTWTYQQLLQEVNKTAKGLQEMGVKKGDRVIFYMSQIPQLLFGVLACARLGAIHSVVFAGFSAKSLADRINDCQARWVLTNDQGKRGSKIIELKKIVDEAIKTCPSIEKVLVYAHTGASVGQDSGQESGKNSKDLAWSAVVPTENCEFPAESMDAEDPLFILYTSGSTGKPKGLVHTCGGYMVHAGFSFENVFQMEEEDIFWCSADIGWITGHTYLTYGPLLAGATTMMFEGVPTWPDGGRFWQAIDRHQVTHFYTAPTAIRALQGLGPGPVRQAGLSSLKVLGTVGEPINQEAWDWFHREVGKEKCPIVDTWWQTETGGIMISPLAGITESLPTYATYPLPGIFPCLVNEKGEMLKDEEEGQGHLCIEKPWPSLARTIYGDHQRFKQTYFSSYPGKYFTGDGARRDSSGRYRITGRVDDVINVSGHRLGTAEIENAIDEHPHVVESAVVGFPHDVKGQGIYAYVIPAADAPQKKEFCEQIQAKVKEVIGPIANPDAIQITPGLPKTRSGKIMRRILRKIAEGDDQNLGDTSTLLDPSVVDSLRQGV